MAKYEVFAIKFDNAAKAQREFIAGTFDHYNDARIFADAYDVHYSSAARVREISDQTATAELADQIRRADDAADLADVAADRLTGLLEALEILTDRNSATADAVLWAMRAALAELTAATDRTATATAAARKLCAQDCAADQRRPYTLDSGETLADFARRVQKLTPEQLEQLDR